MSDIVIRLRATPNRPTIPVSLGNGQQITTMGLGYSTEDDELRKEAANHIESLTTELKECREQLTARDAVLGNIASGTTDTEYPLRAAPREALMDYARQALNGEHK